YKWLKRFREHGREGLFDHSRAPLNHRDAVTPEIRKQLIAFRREHPTWGPLKLIARLGRLHPSMKWPAASTVGEILKAESLVQPRKLRHRVPAYEHPFLGYVEPNDVWGVDFKGQFKLGNGRYCYPFTVSDGVSRYLLGCRAMC